MGSLGNQDSLCAGVVPVFAGRSVVFRQGRASEKAFDSSAGFDFYERRQGLRAVTGKASRAGILPKRLEHEKRATGRFWSGSTGL